MTYAIEHFDHIELREIDGDTIHCAAIYPGDPGWPHAFNVLTEQKKAEANESSNL